MIWRRLFGYFPASLAGGLASFGAVYALTRLLSPADYGFYALALTTLGIVYTLTLTWGEAAAYRFAGEAAAKAQMPNHIRTVMALLAASSAVAIAAMLGAVLIASAPALKLALCVAGSTMILAPVVNAAQEMNRAQQRVSRYSTLRVCQDVGAFVIGTFLAWRSGLGPAAPFAGLASVLAVLAMVEGARLWRESKDGRFEPARVRPYFAYGVPVAIALGLNIALDAGDRFLIAYFLGPEAVGVYAAGYGVADKTVGLVCAWCAAGGAPLMMAAWERGGAAAVRDVSRDVVRALMLVAAPAAAGLALVARPLSEVMIGEAMRDQAAAIIPWIALSGLMSGVVMFYVSEAFVVARRTGLRAGLMVVPVVVNVALNVVLLPVMGVMGAVVATVASYAVALVVLAVAAQRVVALAWPVAEFARIAAAVGAMAVVVAAVPAVGGVAELVAKTVAGAVAYPVAVLVADAGGARAALRQFATRRVRTV